MKSQNKVDYMNIGLIIVSLILAYQIPFELFLFAYAFLGPLHYLTEINWIKEKNYFINNKWWIWIVAFLCIGVVLPKLLYIDFFSFLMDITWVNTIVRTVDHWSNGYIFMVFIMAITFVTIQEKKWQIAIVVLGIIVAFFVNEYTYYQLFAGVFLSTLIHVYLFTLIFMLYGALKNKSKPGYISVLLALACVIFIIVFPVDVEKINLSEDIKNTYSTSGFYILNAKISKLIGLSDGSSFSFDGIIDVKIQIYIAFAYLYHYLNWFSKTTVIGWHKKLTTKRSITILVLWISMILIYLYDYKTGLLGALFLSYLHVFLEFPLNIVSIRSVFQAFKAGLKN